MRPFVVAEKKQRTEMLVGLFLFVGLGLLGWLVLQFGGFKQGFESTYEIEVRFSDASGVIEGTQLKLAGAKIGEVSGTPVLEQGVHPKVRVPIQIDGTRKLPEDTMFQIQSATVLGDKVIVATIPEDSSEKFLEPGALLDGGGAGGLEAIQSDAEQVARDVRILMSDARTSLLKFDAALDDIRAVAGRLGESVEQINEGLLSDENVASLSRTIANVEDASVGAKRVMADVQGAVRQVNRLAQKAEGTFEEIDNQLAQIGPAVEEVPETMKSIRRVATKAEGAVEEAEKTLAKAGETLDSFNNEDGLVGTLAKDEEVSTDTKIFVRNLRRYGILGYKDEETDPEDPRERYRGRRR